MKESFNDKTTSTEDKENIDSIVNILQCTPLKSLLPPPTEALKNTYQVNYNEPKFKELEDKSTLNLLDKYPNLSESIKSTILQNLELKKNVYSDLDLCFTPEFEQKIIASSKPEFPLAEKIFNYTSNLYKDLNHSYDSLKNNTSGVENVENYIKNYSMDILTPFGSENHVYDKSFEDTSKNYLNPSDISLNKFEVDINALNDNSSFGDNLNKTLLNSPDTKTLSCYENHKEDITLINSSDLTTLPITDSPSDSMNNKRKSNSDLSPEMIFESTNHDKNNISTKYTIDGIENLISDILEQKTFLDEDKNNYRLYRKKFKQVHFITIQNQNFVSVQTIFNLWQHLININETEINEKLDSYFLINLFSILRKTLEISSSDTSRYIFRDAYLETNNTDFDQNSNKEDDKSMNNKSLGDQIYNILSKSSIILKTAVLLLNVATKIFMAKKNNTESILDDAVMAFSIIQNDTIAPIFERKNSESKLSAFDELISLSRSVISEVSTLIHLSMLSEKSIIKVSYAIIPQIFLHEIPPWVNQNVVESQCRQCYCAISVIIESNESQRLWLLEEILTSLSKGYHFNKQYNSSRANESKSVRFVSMFLLHIIQLSAVVKHQATEIIKFISNKKVRDEVTQREMFGSAYEKAQSSVQTIINFLFKRCSKKASKAQIGIENDYKNIFDALVEDSVQLANRQNWPSAMLFLRVLTEEIFLILDDEKSDVSKKSIAVDYLASITALIAESTVDLNDSGELQIQKDSNEICFEFEKKSFDLTLNILSKCNNNIGAVFLYTSEWIIENIKLSTYLTKKENSKQQLSSNKKNKPSDSNAQIDKNLLGLNEKKKRITKKELNININNMIKDMYDLVQSALKKQSETLDFNYLSIDKSYSAESFIFIENYFGLNLLKENFLKMLNYINFVLESSVITLRSKALKGLGAIIYKNPLILSNELIKTAINNRLQDSSPLVRDAAVDLLGKYILNNSKLTRQYFKVLCARSMDKGPGVRKRVIRLLKEIYIKSENNDLRPEIGLRLLLRTADDEKGVKDQAQKILKELWLSEPSTFIYGEYKYQSEQHNQTPAIINLGNLIQENNPQINTNTIITNELINHSDNVAALKNNENISFFDLPEEFKKHYISIAETLAAIVAKENDDTYDTKKLIVSFFNSFNQREHDSLLESNYLQILNNTTRIISAVFELIISNKNSIVSKDAILPKSSSQPKLSKVVLSELDFLNLTLLLCKVDSKSISIYAPQLADNIIDYQDTNNTELLIFTLKIFTCVTSEMMGAGKKFLSRLEQQLVLLLQSGSQIILEAAVPCICAFVQHKTRNYLILSKILCYCITQLIKSKQEFQDISISPSYTKNITRVIILSGLLVRYFDFDLNRKISKKWFADLNNSIPENISIPNYILDYYIFFTESNQPNSVKAAALKMIGQLQIGRPDFLVNESVQNIFKSVFSGTDILFKHQLLNNLLEIVQAEIELANENLIKSCMGNNNSSEVDANMLAGKNCSVESGNVASVLQTYLDQILECILQTDLYQNYNIGFELLLLMISQGFVHPLKCMPTLISIESLPKSPLRKKASKVHFDISTKFESFIHSLDIDGVKLAYKTQLFFSSEYTKTVVGYYLKNIYRASEYQLEAALQPLYDTLISNKMKRNHFLKELINIPYKNLSTVMERIDYDYSSISIDESNVEIKKLDSSSEEYIQNLLPENQESSNTDFKDKNINTFYDENVPFTRYIIENILTFRYSTVDEVLFVLNEISKLVANFGFSLLHRFESLNPLRNKISLKEIAECEIKHKHAIEKDTVISIAVGSLLLLRETLKLSYKITESRCNSYSTGESSPSKEKAVFNPVNSLSNHWNLLGYTSKNETPSIKYIKTNSKIIALNWKSWPYATKIPENSQDFKNQRLLYSQLFTDLTSIHASSFS
ncbi:hypothetical protein BB561_000438 [Smittium simulii]|uniref:Sister chromatid cohesion protein n=1 Tax=Smittium simulii TaxID=133385 RepID=A0A2T9YZ45_9FUNG|nr:hypothetical protein BB561_000438 [Smittium simulii]